MKETYLSSNYILSKKKDGGKEGRYKKRAPFLRGEDFPAHCWTRTRTHACLALSRYPHRLLFFLLYNQDKEAQAYKCTTTKRGCSSSAAASSLYAMSGWFNIHHTGDTPCGNTTARNGGEKSAKLTRKCTCLTTTRTSRSTHQQKCSPGRGA